MGFESAFREGLGYSETDVIANIKRMPTGYLHPREPGTNAHRRLRNDTRPGHAGPDLTGELGVKPDGGLKSFGHPIGASGLRMLFECSPNSEERPRRSAKPRRSSRAVASSG
jgi:hypothetical protein